MAASSTRSARRGGENVNDGHRTGGRARARASSRAPGITITPRILYQEIRANGFNRQEVYNLYANPFTTTPAAPVTFDEREQYLLLRESFADDTLLADLNVSVDLGDDRR